MNHCSLYTDYAVCVLASNHTFDFHVIFYYYCTYIHSYINDFVIVGKQSCSIHRSLYYFALKSQIYIHIIENAHKFVPSYNYLYILLTFISIQEASRCVALYRHCVGLKSPSSYYHHFIYVFIFLFFFKIFRAFYNYDYSHLSLLYYYY